MKSKLILAFFLSALVNLNSSAQDKKTRGYNESIIDFKTELGLSDTQVVQIKTVQKEYLPKMKEARNSEDRAAMKQLNEERKSKIEQLLTHEQLEKWQAIKEKLKADRQNPELRRELRNYQKQNIRPIILEKRKAFDDELTSEEKLIIADLRAKREAFLKSAKEENKEERKQRGKELKLEASKILQPIIEKNKPALEKIATELQPLQIQWESDLNTIRMKHISGYKSKSSGKRKNKMRLAMQFLLMDIEK